MGSGPPPRRRDRRLRAADASCLPLVTPQDVYAPLELDADLLDDGRRFADWQPGGAADVVILHFALPSPLTPAFREHRGRRVLLHHNITPPEYFTGWDDELARICRIRRDELRRSPAHCDLGLADSETQPPGDFEALGVARTGVLPICIDLARYREAESPVLATLEDGTGPISCSSGACAPNKRPEDLIRLLRYWKRYVSRDVRLVLVGKPPRRRSYFDALPGAGLRRGFRPDEVLFLGHVAARRALACYRRRACSCRCREHEGFGVPLVGGDADARAGARLRGGRGAARSAAPAFASRERLAEVAEMAPRSPPTNSSAARAGAQDRRVHDFAPERVLGALRSSVESL